VFLELPVSLLLVGASGAEQAFAEAFVVRSGDIDELHAALAQVLHGGDDVSAAKGDVLHAGSGVEGDEFLDLGLAQARRGFVDGHLDGRPGGGGGHDDGGHGGVGLREEAVVGGPEAVEGEGVLVVIADCLQSAPALVADAVVDCFEGDGG
ncbi:MAG: hypothetical protein Q9193_001770, partial [Seirophora villosa]